MKSRGEIPLDIKRIELARLVHKALKKAARDYPDRQPPVPSVGVRHIANELENWGCWPGTR
jgi:hypothetical protein